MIEPFSKHKEQILPATDRLQNNTYLVATKKLEKLINLDYSRVEVTVDARRRPMKLWLSTANGLQRSRCGEIGSPEGKKCR